MSCWCGKVVGSEKQEVHFKTGEKNVLLSSKAGAGIGTTSPSGGQATEAELLIKAGALQPTISVLEYPREGWDEVAPCCISEAGQEQWDYCEGMAAATDVLPVRAGTPTALELQLLMAGLSGAGEDAGEEAREETDRNIMEGEEEGLAQAGSSSCGELIGQQGMGTEQEEETLEEEAEEEGDEDGFPPAPRETLQPLADPEQALLASLTCLDAAEDNPCAIIRALNTLRRLAVHHSHLLEPYLRPLAVLLAGYVSSEEDMSVSIVATFVVTDLVVSYGDALVRHCDDRRDPENNSLVLALLHKANSMQRPITAVSGKRPGTATARRVQQEWEASPAGMADLTLRVMGDYFSQNKMVGLLQPFTHYKQPTKIRSAAAALLVAAVYRRS